MVVVQVRDSTTSVASRIMSITRSIKTYTQCYTQQFHTASSAAFRVYNNSLTSFTGIDQSRSMRDGYDLVMKSLLESTYNSGLSRQASSSASFRKRKVMNRSDGYDLIVVSHVLLETPGEKVSSMIRDLWGILNEDGMLVVIEPGNPVGFKNVMQVRQKSAGEECWRRVLTV